MVYDSYAVSELLSMKGVKKVNRIKEIRESKGLQQKELAELVGLSAPYLHDLENNRRGAKPETLERIANGLGVSVMELTGKEAV